MEHSQELAALIRARISELESDLDAHRRALAVLEEPSADLHATSNGKPRRRTAQRRADNSQSRAQLPDAKPVTRRPRPVVSAEAVFDVVKEGNDQAAVIAKEFGVSTAVVRQRLEQLEQAGRVSRTGERRGTRWRSHAAS